MPHLGNVADSTKNAVSPDLGVSKTAGWSWKVDVVGSHSQMAPEGPSGPSPPTSMKLSPKGSAAARHSGAGRASVGRKRIGGTC